MTKAKIAEKEMRETGGKRMLEEEMLKEEMANAKRKNGKSKG